MDYSQILGSQLVSKKPRYESEDEFYNACSFEWFARLRGGFGKLANNLKKLGNVPERPSRRSVQSS